MGRPFAEIDDQTTPYQVELLRTLDRAPQSPLIQRARARAREAWQLDRPRRLLDVGAGSGDVARGLVPLVGADGEVVALDNSAAMIDVARRRDDQGLVRYVVGDVRSLPYADGYFDGVRSERVLQHLADPDTAITEMTRVLRPGGRICLIDTEWTSLLVDGSPKDLQAAMTPVLSFLTQDWAMGRSLRRRLRLAGLERIEATPVTMATASREEAALVLPIFTRETMENTPVAMDEQAESWLEAVEQAVADGTFLFALTIWVATATKP